jgi:hypothetical protein
LYDLSIQLGGREREREREEGRVREREEGNQYSGMVIVVVLSGFTSTYRGNKTGSAAGWLLAEHYITANLKVIEEKFLSQCYVQHCH